MSETKLLFPDGAMPAKLSTEAGNAELKQRYRVTNWPAYDRSLLNRGQARAAVLGNGHPDLS